jgi:ubiquinone/menaquinone biosynthesis C-methylase UbiE
MDKKINRKTSWGSVAGWYDNLLKKENTYQTEVVLPKLLKMMNIKSSDNILDLACGQGFFAREFAKIGARVTGVDISKELIKIAQEQNKQNINYVVSSADNLIFLKDKSIDKITIILALQNINNLSGVIKECYRVLKMKGKLFIVLNHPAFRVPQKSDWGYDDKKKVQFRRVEKYLSEILINIDMNPGEKIQKNKVYTTSFHRPLQTYFKNLNDAGFLISGFEEWISNRKSQNGPKQKVEDAARKEIPMFACIEAIKS